MASGSGSGSGEHWPEVKAPTAAYRKITDEALKTYRDNKYDAADYIVDYRFDGSYLNFEHKKSWRDTDTITLDDQGVPKMKQSDGYYYHPVMVEQYALSQYGLYLAGHDDKYRTAFLAAAQRLLSLQSADGAFRYGFKFRYYLSGQVYDRGWVSAMAQGQAMSVFARAYLVSGENVYLDAGERALDFLSVPIDQGGTRSDLGDLDPSLSGYVFYEEWVSTPDGYTLNGYMFTVLGMYDWCQLAKKERLPDAGQCQDMFDDAIRTLVKILPYYDLGNLSSYDLGQYTFGKEVPHVAAHYHLVHIYLLHTLYSVTGEQTLQEFEKRWNSYVQ